MCNSALHLVSILSISLSAVTPALAQFEQEVKNVAIFIHEGVELFDFAGPGEVFVAAGRQSPVLDFNVYTVAPTGEEVTSQTFLRVIPNYSIENCPPPDVIVLPGGATSIPLRYPKVIAWIQRSHVDADLTLSVCTGAFLLGKAGLLDGLKATTHWGSIERLRAQYPNTEVLEETKFVDNGRIVTSGGVSSGTEGSLHVVSRMAGQATAERVARYMEYNNWDGRLGLIEKENAFIAAVRSSGFEAALAQHAGTPVFYGELLNLASEYLENGRAAEALPLLRHLTKRYPVMETYTLLGSAFAQLGKEAPPSETRMLAMIRDGGLDRALKVYAQTKEAHPQWVLFSEAAMNRLGYEFMNAGRMDEAIRVFLLNTREYPYAFNTWDSLGEACLKSGETDLARQYTIIERQPLQHLHHLLPELSSADLLS